MASNQPLLISELYDKATVQGEGPLLGTPCTFMRLGGCNLTCGKGWQKDPTIWKCDTPYTWDWTGMLGTKYKPHEELGRVSPVDIASWLWRYNTTTMVRLLVVTGGEPLLQDQALGDLFRSLHSGLNAAWWGTWEVQIETNGTIKPEHCAPYIHHFSVSPKLANSGNSLESRRDVEALRWYGGEPRAVFKFVVNTPDDFVEIDEIVSLSQIPYHKVYIMPEGIDAGAVNAHASEVVDAVIKRGYNLTTRLHVMLYGNKRGV